jgi:hypothetical protein
MTYGGQTGEWPPQFAEINLAGVTLASAPMIVDLEGLPGNLIGTVIVEDSVFTEISGPVDRVRNAAPVIWRNVSVNGRLVG